MAVILGGTASGKAAAALHAAETLGAEIVSVDSMKVYRRMDIGTAKPSPEARRRVWFHLIDVVEPSESFSVAQYLERADAAVAQIAARGRPVLAAGGTALYLKALIEGLFEGPSRNPAYRRALRARAAAEGVETLHAELARIDPQAAGRIHPNDLRRIERALEVHHVTGRPISEFQTQWERGRRRYDCRLIGIRRQREDQARRINARVRRMIDQGLVEEVRSLLDEPAGLSDQAAQAVGYAEIIAHLRGEMSLDDAIERIKINTRRLAKSQRTWFRRFPGVYWIDAAPDEPAESVAERVLAHIGGNPPEGT